MALRPAVFDANVAAFCESSFGQALLEDGDVITHRFGRCAAEKTNHWNRELLSVQSQRPRCRSAAKQGYELAPLHVSPFGRAAEPTTRSVDRRALHAAKTELMSAKGQEPR